MCEYSLTDTCRWYPTWQKDGQMIVKSVKMFQEAGYNGCEA